MYDENFNRITRNPAVMGGKPCIRGMQALQYAATVSQWREVALAKT